MSAFGKRGGMSGGRPSFGVAKPMKGSGKAQAIPAEPDGGDQFPPLDELTPAADAPSGPAIDIFHRVVCSIDLNGPFNGRRNRSSVDLFSG